MTQRFGARAILKHLSLERCAGECMALVGESGAGKSTPLNLITDLELPDAGRIHIDGTDSTRVDEDSRTRLRRTKVGFVF
ncbi:MAG: ATP-binding cassette domain-containing protein [Thiocapsa sp.]|nr:ATP-binding cassette domain-containing protein [Thiocapsa sp.]MCG6985801.1 ATP-binding cassette domain-containing protein [Thiocapsa sp.]